MKKTADILIVDDERNIRFFVAEALQNMYNVSMAGSGEEALGLVKESSFDLILLDIHMPQMDGLQVLKAIKEQHPYVAVIMLTGYGSVDTAIHALRNGATNYLQKPASNEQILESVQDGLAQAQRERQRNTVLLKARQFLQASLKQLDKIAPEQVDLVAEATEVDQTLDPDRFLQRGSLLIDTYRRVATLNGEMLDLTAGEYDLLHCLARHAPRVLDPQEIVQETRGFECSLMEARELIRWQIYLLRQKVEPEPSSPRYLLNVRGRGYMWAQV